MKLHNPFKFYVSDVSTFLSVSMIITFVLVIIATIVTIGYLLFKLHFWLIIPLALVAIGRVLYAVFTGR